MVASVALVSKEKSKVSVKKNVKENVHMTLGRKVCWYEKSPKKNRKKIVQWSHPKRVSEEGVQVFIKDFPYLVGFVR